nr:hypothetical protein GCM10020092_001390 [Actinoplanes digitatis]
MGAFEVRHLTLVLSPLTFLQPLPARTATRSSIVTVLPERVTTTLFWVFWAALYCTVLTPAVATPVVAACAGVPASRLG